MLRSDKETDRLPMPRNVQVILATLLLSVVMTGCVVAVRERVEVPGEEPLRFEQSGVLLKPAPDDETLIPPDPNCNIKGNVSTYNDKTKNIYHMPDDHYYGYIRVNPEEGDAWFCSEEEARDAGFLRTLR